MIHFDGEEKNVSKHFTRKSGRWSVIGGQSSRNYSSSLDWSECYVRNFLQHYSSIIKPVLLNLSFQTTL